MNLTTVNVETMNIETMQIETMQIDTMQIETMHIETINIKHWVSNNKSPTMNLETMSACAHVFESPTLQFSVNDITDIYANHTLVGKAHAMDSRPA